MSPRKLLGAVLVAAVASLLLTCRDREEPSPEPTPAAAVAEPDGGATAPSAPEEVPQDRPLPLPNEGYAVREGHALFNHYCATCHGAEGHGDGFNAYSLDPKPRDLTDPTFQAQRSSADLEAVIHSGGASAGLSTGMPPWGRTLNDRQIHHLVTFLRTLRASASEEPG